MAKRKANPAVDPVTIQSEVERELRSRLTQEAGTRGLDLTGDLAILLKYLPILIQVVQEVVQRTNPGA